LRGTARQTVDLNLREGDGHLRQRLTKPIAQSIGGTLKKSFSQGEDRCDVGHERLPSKDAVGRRYSELDRERHKDRVDALAAAHRHYLRHRSRRRTITTTTTSAAAAASTTATASTTAAAVTSNAGLDIELGATWVTRATTDAQTLEIGVGLRAGGDAIGTKSGIQAAASTASTAGTASTASTTAAASTTTAASAAGGPGPGGAARAPIVITTTDAHREREPE
jgi:hypothetical protein